MTQPEMDPLPPELDALLSAERARPDPADEVRDRLHARVVATLLLGVAGAAAGAGASAASSSSGSSLLSGLTGLLGKKATIGVAAFLVGGVAGASVHAIATAPRVEATSAAVAPSQSAGQGAGQGAGKGAASPVDLSPPLGVTPVTSVAAGTSGASVQAASAPPTGVAVAANSGGKDGSLEAEKGLIDQARAALLRGDPASALAAIGDHQKRYPAGTLTEEREALAVQALARAGRVAEARARGERFDMTYKKSIHRPTVDAVLESLP